MFFYLYAIIELLAIFLDSGIIPTANVSYPVSPTSSVMLILDRAVANAPDGSGSQLCIQV